MTHTTINGFPITEPAAKVLAFWHESQAPARYAECIGKIQDLLCRIMMEGNDHQEDIKIALIDLISIKDDLKEIVQP